MSNVLIFIMVSRISSFSVASIAGRLSAAKMLVNNVLCIPSLALEIFSPSGPFQAKYSVRTLLIVQSRNLGSLEVPAPMRARSFSKDSQCPVGFLSSVAPLTFSDQKARCVPPQPLHRHAATVNPLGQPKIL